MGKEQMIGTARHEIAHALVAKHLGVGVKRVDVRPQGHGVLGVTEIVSTSMEKHVAIAMASVAGGHDGTGGDTGVGEMIRYVSKGAVTPEHGRFVASMILAQYDHEVLDIAAEKIVIEHGGVIIGDELYGIIFEAKEEKKRRKEQPWVMQKPVRRPEFNGVIYLVSEEEQKRREEEEERKRLLEQFFEESRRAA